MGKSTILIAIICLTLSCVLGNAVASESVGDGQRSHVDHTSLEPPEHYSGVWEVKNNQGRLIEIKSYVNGELHGPYIKWYDNGVLHWVYNFSLGEPKGRQITFDKQGEILDSSVK